MGRNFKNIIAWQYADDLAVLIYSKIKLFPQEELYGLVSQLRRAAVSVPTNIAEGAGRKSKKEYLQFLYISKGSLAETEYLLHFSNRVGYLKDNEYKELEEMFLKTVKTLSGLINSVKKDLDNGRQ